jgi:1-aminocyclopropane-1-carboxylate deaminase/D-cysteine desulfhydrase-like pyridoxal-dependent ACC family enzyme
VINFDYCGHGNVKCICPLCKELTPVERINDIYVKRDDLFKVAGVNGGKARTCWFLAEGAKGLITTGARQSPQVNIVAHIAKAKGIPCRVHVPWGAFTPELEDAKKAGAEIVQHKPGYNTVIIRGALDDLKNNGDWTYIPFGMECEEAVRQTAQQVANLPHDINRVVVPVGSGMTLAGVLQGLVDYPLTVPVFGVAVGADPTKRLDKYAPSGWREMVELVRSEHGYHEGKLAWLGPLMLDPIYEAKCLEYLRPGDLFWIVGIRQTAVRA